MDYQQKFDMCKDNLRFGILPSPPDPRDWQYSRIVPIRAIPRKFRIPHSNPIKNQGDWGTCVGQAGAFAQEMADGNERRKVMQYSPRFLYTLCKDIDPFGKEVEGTDLRSMAKVLAKHGICEESFFPYNLSNRTLYAPDVDAMMNAFPNRVSAYAKLNNLAEIKQAVADGRKVVIAMYLFSNFAKAKDGVVPMPEGRFWGGHAMCVVGYDDDTQLLEVSNSWGNDPSTKNGYNFLPYAYVDGGMIDFHFPYLLDAYSLLDFVDPTPPPQPKPEFVIPDKLTPVKRKITTLYNGKPIEGDVPAMIIQEYGRTFVPLRLVAEAFGKKVEWDEATGTIRITD